MPSPSEAAQERLQRLVSSSPAVLYSLRPDFAAAWVSDNLERLLGYTPAEALAPGWWPDHLHPDDRAAAVAAQGSLLRDGSLAHEYRFADKTGAYRWIHDEMRVLRDAAGEPAEIVGSWSDVTPRKEAELRLRETAEQYRLLFEHNPQPMWVYDRDTLRFLAVNVAAVRHYGYTRDEFLTMTLRDIRPPEELHTYDQQVARRRASGTDELYRPPGTWRHRRKDGSTIEVEVVVGVIRFAEREAALALLTDVTEKRKLEAQFLQAQKMESVGRLAGGVAHDFNNLLGVITGYGELMRRQLPPGDPLARRLDGILKAADRAADLTRQLLAFSRKQVLQPRVLDLNVVTRDMEQMLRRLIGEDIQLVTVYADRLGRVRADPGQLSQVIVNLAVNARDAMPQGGRLVVETANADLDQSYAAIRPEVRPGPYVMLSVSDNGTGMAPETMERIFEPFFTTKGEGRGTGLGLSTVYGIVKQSGGHIWTYSEPGKGTTFKVFLPRVEGAADPARPAPAPAAEGGPETVLLVEDDEALRSVMTEALRGAGYDVLTARDGHEALAVAGRHRGPIHLVVSDMVMPGMGGDALARLMPNRPFLFISGYTEQSIAVEGGLTDGAPFLSKPFTPSALLRRVREVLDTAGRGRD